MPTPSRESASGDLYYLMRWHAPFVNGAHPDLFVHLNFWADIHT